MKNTYGWSTNNNNVSQNYVEKCSHFSTNEGLEKSYNITLDRSIFVVTFMYLNKK